MDISPTTGLNRRQMLLGGAAATALAVAHPQALAVPVEFPPPIPPGKIPPAPVPLFEDPTLTFQCLFAFGAAAFGAAEYGEVATAVKAVQARDESYAAYFHEFRTLARRTARMGHDARKRGRVVTARGAYLRASNYYAQALYFVLATGRPTRKHEGEVYNSVRRNWLRAGRLMDPPMQAVRIPWKGAGGPLPGWFLRPDRQGGRRPTLIMNNGSDAQMIDLWSAGGLSALQRGWNVLIFEGPGQGGMLFNRNRTFIPDWERVITPIVDWLRTRTDVDRERIVLSGSSFGGELVPRAAAFESRIAAFSADPGVVDAATPWIENFPPEFVRLFREGKAAELNREWREIVRSVPPNEKFNFAKRLEIYPGRTFFDKLTAIVQFTNESVLGRIKRPMLVLDNEVEQFFPGQPRAMYRDLTRSPGKKYHNFTIAQGAQFHCEPMAPQLRNSVVMDWFGKVVGERGGLA